MTVNLADLSAVDGIFINGQINMGQAGASVSLAGDVNGDGFEDFIIGSPLAGSNQEGGAFVIYGGNDITNINLGDLTTAQGIFLTGDDQFDSAGSTVASVGDVNGDGFDDVIFAAARNSDGGMNAGAAYVIFGGNNLTDIDVTNLTSSQGFFIQGANQFDDLGTSLSGGQDVNDDGFDDLIVGIQFADDGFVNTGQSVIIFGGESLSNIDLATFSGPQAVIITGALEQDTLGRGVSLAGDINGDGIDDIVVSSARADGGGNSSGEAYVIYGSDTLADLNLAMLNNTQGIIITGDMEGDFLGGSISSAGDVNGDGFDDFILGAESGDNGGDDAGEAYIIFGGSNLTNIDLSNLDNSQGIIIQGDMAGDNLGTSVARAGDFNGDGFDDVIVGAPLGDNGADAAGEAYVIFGGANLTNIDLSNLDFDQGLIIENDMAGEVAGLSVSGGGDINNDGFDDVIIGILGDDSFGFNSGQAVVIFGRAFTAGDDILRGSNADDVILGGAGNDTLVGIGGDDVINGDTGNDTLNGNAGDDIIDGGDGIDTILAGGGNDTANGGAGNDTISGQSGSDTLNGNAGSDTINGNSGNDTIDGGSGIDTINGGGGDDIINGGTSDDILNGSIGVDMINGGAGDDIIQGNNQGDELFGDSGDDTILGGAGNDTINGGRDNDTLIGGAAQDDLFGDSGNDSLEGNSGGDDLFGGEGDDILNGGGGNDDLNGGAGADTFVFTAPIGVDRVQDFEDGIDTLDFSGFAGAGSFADVIAVASQLGANVRFDFNPNNVIILEGFDLADLDADDFAF